MIMLALGVAFSLQAGEPAKRLPTFVRDSSVADSTSARAPRRLPVTAEVLATAFRDDQARSLFYRARTARMAQDSSLASYDANVRARISVGLSIGLRGRERVLYRQESASRVRWRHDVGARVELLGARMALPIAPEADERNEFLSNIADGAMSPIPYFPGYEAVWIGGRAQNDVDDRRLVNPLAEGAEAYYTYESGDSLRSTLPDGRVMAVRELRVRPRSPKWNLAVGSLMFDMESGRLVQAAYRLAAPIDVWASNAQNLDSSKAAQIGLTIARGIVSPFRNQISEVAIEYSLHEGRFWLPRSRTMRGMTQVAFARMPVTIEHSYRFSSVNREPPGQPIEINTPNFLAPVTAPDSLTGAAARAWVDSVRKSNRVARDALRDSLAKGACDATGTRTIARKRFDGQLAVAVLVPCDIDKLITSSELSGSIYDDGEEAFGSTEREELVARVLALGAQAPLGSLLPSPRLEYGLPMTRFNRVEGFSTGLLLEQQLGGGYVGTVSGRIGTADREPNVELSLARTNLDKAITLAGYNRLVSASDWGRPLSFGSSVSAILFGRDEGFYFRASGAELGFQSTLGARLDWRLFAERQRSARQETSFSVGGDLGPNIDANRVLNAGAAVRLLHARGVDPRGVRLFSDVRLEGAGGDSSYGRAAVEVTLSRGLPNSLALALTVGAGSSVGGVPTQRRWYLGGTHTIRGQRPDTARSGNAFWLTRAEVGRDIRAHRATLFGDLGWVGDRSAATRVGRPLSGAGVGMSVMDGLLRFDVARGMFPDNRFRVDLYLGGRW